MSKEHWNSSDHGEASEYEKGSLEELGSRREALEYEQGRMSKDHWCHRKRNRINGIH